LGEKSLFRLLPLLIFVIIAAEIVVFVAAIELFGGLAVLVATFATGIAGSLLLRRQGLKALSSLDPRRPRDQTSTLEAIVSGAWLALAGLLLIFPGFIADALGILLILPPIRQFLTKWSGKWFSMHPSPDAAGSGWSRSGPVIEGEAVEVPDEPREKRPLIQ
jgi:UPF0716 protein FxsA